MTNEELKTIETGNSDDCREFHVVGVGASAGGLEALEELFNELPDDTGMAFVVIQHLSPDFKSHMEELLARRTKMPIHRVENGMEVEPNSLYLIPPKMEMVIREGKLLLTEKGPERSLSHPIDQFFRSLASDAGRYSIGIVLSGTGSDGSRGIRDIHEAGGLVVAQDGDTSKFDGMPLNAQATGVVDLVLQPKAIAEALVRYVKEGLDPSIIAQQEISATMEKGVDRVFQLLHQQHGVDFSHYKSNTVSRRIQRRIDLMGLGSLEEYVEQLNENSEEINDLYKDLLIGVTKFFRDPEAFEILEKEVIPKLYDARESMQPIRVWTAGCASGEEAYSIAMLLDEEARRRGQNSEIKIFATDAHHVSLNTAARGVYSEEVLSEMTLARRNRYFRKERDGYHVVPEIRKMIVFAPHNLISDAPFTQMDLVTCRNLLIYLQPNAQKKALSMFHFSLKSGGTLFLGPSESPGEIADEFQVIDKRWRLYKKRRDVRLPMDTRLPFTSGSDGILGKRTAMPAPRSSKIDETTLATYDRLLDRRMPPSILVDSSHEILHIFGGAERYLRPRGGRPSNNLSTIIIEGLRTALVGAMQHSARKQDVVRYTGVEVHHGDEVEDLNILVEPIVDRVNGIQNLLIEFEPAVRKPVDLDDDAEVDLNRVDRERVSSLESELRFAQENLQATVEEMETSNEELQATNEELIASNEELQSTNEELHSVNEELYTVNAEYQRRVDELARANDDMDNLLATTRVGVIFLDAELCIRRFTPEISRLFHLLPQDIGRFIEGFAHHLICESLADNLRATMLDVKEQEFHASDRSGSQYLLRMLPYRSGEEVDGVVLTILDISSLRTAETESRKFQFMTESASDSVTLANADGQFVYANPAAVAATGYSLEELLTKNVTDLNTSVSPAEFEALFRRAVSEEIPPFEAIWRRKDDEKLPVEISINSVLIDGERFLSASIRDITERRLVERELEQMGAMIEGAHDAIIVWELDGAVQRWNAGAVQLYGYTTEEAIGEIPQDLLKAQHSSNWKRVRKRLFEKGQWAGEVEHQKKSGKKIIVSSRMQLLETPQGEQLVLEINRDVSRQHRIQEQLEKANEVAEKANEAKSAFLANISHELRTPMTAVLGFAEMLRQHSADPDYTEKVDTIMRNGQYLLSLLNDILDLSKIEAGKIDVKEESVSVPRLIDDIRDLMDNRSEAAGVPLTFEFLSEVPGFVTADRMRTRQILVNLIGNALKFTDNGSVKVLIDVEYESSDEDNRLRIQVADTGIGMTPEQVNSLFRPFTQASQETGRKFGGTGLGLSVSRRLAEHMGGRISVSSELGVGSTFALYLPIKKVEENNMGLPVIQPLNAIENSDAALMPTIKAKILLADDRRDVWRVARYFLEKCGAEVEVAEDGRQAVDAVNRNNEAGLPFDLILMDMQMPIMTGQEAVAELRRSGCNLPIIALTADAMEGERESCLAIGCDEYSPKPIDGPKLMHLIKSMLEKHKS